MAASRAQEGVTEGQDRIAPAARRRFLAGVCRRVAFLGGVALLGAMLLIVASVIGGVFKAPVLGDTEIVELLVAIAVFAFLPYCHLQGGNVIVDFFARPLPRAARDWLDAATNAAFAVVAGFLAWRLVAGGISSFVRDQRGMFLQLPEWPIYALGSAACVLWIAVIAHSAYECTLRARGKLPPLESQAGHAV